jgi:hypothetical protein
LKTVHQAPPRELDESGSGIQNLAAAEEPLRRFQWRPQRFAEFRIQSDDGLDRAGPALDQVEAAIQYSANSFLFMSRFTYHNRPATIEKLSS